MSIFEFFQRKYLEYVRTGKTFRLFFLNKLRSIIIKYFNPVIKYQIGEYTLKIQLSHMLPVYQVRFQNYDTAIARIAAFVYNKRKYRLNIVDVGANIGDTVATIKTKVKECNILCIEGEPTFFALLHKNFDYDSSILIKECFCGDINTNLSNSSLKTENGTSMIIEDKLKKNSDEISVSTLDSIIDKIPLFINVDLIKIDTDGFDYKVLRGSIETIKKSSPYVFFELDKLFLSNNNEDIMSIFSYFNELNYSSAIVYDNFGYLIGLFSLTDTDTIKMIIDYSYYKKLYVDILMVKNKIDALEYFSTESHFFRESLT